METTFGHINASGNSMHASRQCGSCGAENIAVARFCGNCGSVLAEIALQSPVRSRRRWFFKGVMTLALFILVASMVMSYQLFNSTDSIKVSSLPFADIPTDHPVYRLCTNLVKIQAIGYRKILEFAPHEAISAAEWNYALNASARQLGRVLPDYAFFQEGSEVSVDLLREKISALTGKPKTFSDNSRIRSFYQLECALFNGRPSL